LITSAKRLLQQNLPGGDLSRCSKRRGSRRSLTLGVACAALVPPAFAGDASATAFITAIYDSYKGKDAKGTLLDSERTIRRYFEPELAA
jgi:hypothetical protein